MQRKITTLEDENKGLRCEISQYVTQTDETEEQERLIMADLSKQLSSTNVQFDSLNLELERYKDENRLQYDEIINLSRRLADAEMRLHQLTSENEETSSLLCITKENQDMLATELTEFKARYYETLSLLHETQDLVRKQSRKSLPAVRASLISSVITSNQYYQMDSLQSELMDSLDSGILSDTGSRSYKNVYDTMKFVQNNATNKASSDGMSQIGSMAMSTLISQPRMSSHIYCGAIPSQTANPFYSSIYGVAPTTINCQDIVPQETEDHYPAKSQLGMQGCPGAKDLEEALKRLTPSEVLSRRAMFATNAPMGAYSYDEPPMCRTPESIFSTTSGTSSTTQWRLPKKLEIVKPIEGSQTLNQWNRLATPTMGGILQDNAHIKVRGERRLEEFGLQTYSLSDLEEDEEHPGKQFESSSVYTFTNSTVMHPDDGTSSITFSLPPSQVTSRMQSTANSRQPTAPPTPRNLSRKNSCSTFSVSMGLASMLNERGIKAVTPSCLNTPVGPNYSPTVTPCNSPDIPSSPERPLSPEPGPSLYTSNRNINAFQHLEKKALRSIKLLERVENLGLENLITTLPSPLGRSPLALYSSNIYTSRSSPMAQLTSLKQFVAEKRVAEENLRKYVEPIDKTKSDVKKPNTDRRLSRLQRQKSRRSMVHGQRQDLGTVNMRTDLGKIDKPTTQETKMEEKSLVEGFVGSISSLLFGRKGGLL